MVMPSQESELEIRWKIAQRLIATFRIERMTYLIVTVVAFVMLLASGLQLLQNDGFKPSTLTLLFGSSGLLGLGASQILRMWEQALNWIGPAGGARSR